MTRSDGRTRTRTWLKRATVALLSVALATGGPWQAALAEGTADTNDTEPVALVAQASGIPYYDPNETKDDKVKYANLCPGLQAPGNNRETIGEGWYTFYGNPTYTERVTISGDVNLILQDGNTMTCRDGIFVPEGSSLTIWGQSTDKDTMGKLVVSASELKAGIGAVEDEDGGTVTINGGNVKATGGEKSAGIGGAYDADAGSVTINGGYVEATGGNNSAGIGSGYSAECGSVTITGGEVHAHGTKGGAGIGGGYKETNDTVSITGGKVYAYGASGGAGIGSGSNASCEGNITIDNAYVFASGSSCTYKTGSGYQHIVCGAGIGGGAGEGDTSGDFESTITIKNAAKVDAHAGVPDSSSSLDVYGGAGIGAGAVGNANKGKAYITDSYVEAYGSGDSGSNSHGAAGIGGGAERSYYGGEGMGLVNVEGLNTVVVAQAGKGASAIGHGDDDSYMGDLTIADELKVQAGNDGTNYERTFLYRTTEGEDERVGGCNWRRSARIEACDHPDAKLINAAAWGHLYGTCVYCNHEPTGEAHSYGDDGKCTVCGYASQELVTISFDGNGGTGEMKSVTYMPEYLYAPPTCDFTPPANQAFAGWELVYASAPPQGAPTGIKQAGEEFKLPRVGILTLQATWESKTASVTFSAGELDAGEYTGTMAPGVAKLGDKYSLPGCRFVPVEGAQAHFTGWKVDDKGDVLLPFVKIDVAGDLALVAQWQRYWKVTYDADNGDNPEVVEVNDGGVAPVPAEPEKDGYAFLGWRLDNADYDFATPVTGNVTLTAAWEQRSYTVSFDSDGGSEVASLTVPHGGKAARPADPTKDGYAFTGWSLGDESYDFSTHVTADLALVAAWEPLTYEVTFDSAGGSEVAPQSVSHGEKAERPADPTREGHEFKGWTLDGEAYDFSQPVTGDLALVAAWEPLTYTVTFQDSDGTVLQEAQVAWGEVPQYEGETPSLGGRTFTGWDPELEAAKADATYRATYMDSQAVVTHAVTFDSAGGTEVEAQQVVEGEVAKRPADPTREGHEFKGWTLEGEAYDFSQPVTGDLALAAAWEPLTFTVTFQDSDGATLQESRVAWGEVPQYAGETPSLGGRTFTGWDPELEAAKADATYRATYMDSQAAQGPMLMTHSLTLSGAIGVDYFMDLSSLTAEELAGCSMEFTVGTGAKQTTHTAELDPAFRDANGKGYYGFSCPTTSVQMADTIRATFRWGGQELELPDYSVEAYVEQFEAARDSYPEAMRALVHAVADYGHYAQPYLAQENGWEVGSDYAAMGTCYTDSYEPELASIESGLSAHAASGSYAGTPVASATMRLYLDSGTSVEVLLSPAEGAAFSADDVAAVSGSFPGREASVTLRPDGRVSVRVDGVSAHLLATPLVVSCGGREVLRASALSFAGNVLAAEPGTAARDAMCALYRYHEAAAAVIG